MTMGINHTTKQALIYKLQAMCGSGSCIVCRGPLKRRHFCAEHSDYEVHVWSESQNFSHCVHCGHFSVRNGRCCLCQHYSPVRMLTA